MEDYEDVGAKAGGEGEGEETMIIAQKIEVRVQKTPKGSRRPRSFLRGRRGDGRRKTIGKYREKKKKKKTVAKKNRTETAMGECFRLWATRNS